MNLQSAKGFQAVSRDELCSVDGGGKISFKFGLIGIAIGNAILGDAGGGVGLSVGKTVGTVVEKIIDVVS